MIAGATAAYGAAVERQKLLRGASFVLVHGAWHGAWCWRRVAALLASDGHDVFTPTLTGLAERSHLLSPAINLDTHILDVVNEMKYRELNNVVLVGHSYGGMVVTGVADKIPDKITSLVYLDAFVPENSQSLSSLVPQGGPAPALESGSDWRVAPLPPEAFGPVSAERRAFFEAKTSPQPAGTMIQALTLTGGIDRIKHKTYIYCNVPAPTTFTQFYEKLKNRPGWVMHTLPCTHMAQTDMPNELTQMLVQAIP